MLKCLTFFRAWNNSISTAHKTEMLGCTPGVGGGGGGGTLIFSYIRRLGPFFWVQNFEFRYFLGFSEK